MFENSSSPTMLLDGNVLLMILLLTISLQKPICAPLVPMVLPFPTQNALALLNYISSYFVFSSHFLFPTNPISSIHIQFIKFILKCCYHSKT